MCERGHGNPSACPAKGRGIFSGARLTRLALAGRDGGDPLERAAAPQTKVAAAELDHFCCAKIGTQTILRCAGPAETPTLVCSAKRGLIFSRRSPQPRPTIELLLKVPVATRYRPCVGDGFAEHKRRAPKEWRETAKRFKARNRLRVARRAAAVEQSHPRCRVVNGANPQRNSHSDKRTKSHPKVAFQISNHNAYLFT